VRGNSRHGGVVGSLVPLKMIHNSILNPRSPVTIPIRLISTAQGEVGNCFYY
jgi:hypothetical protein